MVLPEKVFQRVRRARECAGNAPWLVGYDANGIQEIITACGRPVSMRGASEVIKGFDARMRERYRDLVVFAGGGRGVCLACSEEEARAMARELVAAFREKTRYGVLATAHVPFDPHAEAASIRWLRHKLDMEKDAADTPVPDLPPQRELECAFCHRYHGTIPWKRDDDSEEVEMVCQRCSAMIKAGREAGREERGAPSEMSRSLADIARRNDGSIGPIAAVSADGNNLGVLFESLSSLEALAAVSEAVAAAFTHAHEEAQDSIPEERRLPLVVGGDDIRAFLVPHALLGYVEILARTVEAEAERYARLLRSMIGNDTADRLAGLGIGIGAVIADVYYPSWRLMEYAHELEVHAKTASYGKSVRSVFDFAVITTEAAVTAGVVHGRSVRDSRPFSLAPDAWQPTLRNVDALARVPKTQRGILAAEATMAAEEFANLFRYQVARTKEWRCWYTQCGVDWRDAQAVMASWPDRGLLELLALRTMEKSPL